MEITAVTVQSPSSRSSAKRVGFQLGQQCARSWLWEKRPHLGEINRARKEILRSADETLFEMVPPEWSSGSFERWRGVLGNAFKRGVLHALQSMGSP